MFVFGALRIMMRCQELILDTSLLVQGLSIPRLHSQASHNKHTLRSNVMKQALMIFGACMTTLFIIEVSYRSPNYVHFEPKVVIIS